MIILKKIYSTPKGLFKEVEFKKGLNLILGVPKKEEGIEKICLNSIGKSTLVSLIDFCLLSDFTKAHKLYKAKSFMDSYKIVLEIEIETEIVRIERSTSSAKKISMFSSLGEDFESIELDTAKRILFEKLFLNKDYSGIQENSWLRSVLPIFLRDEKDGYGSPIEYIKHSNVMTLNIFHLMLLNINNSLAITNKKVLEEIKQKKENEKEIKKILTAEYGDLGAINSKIDKLEEEISSLIPIKGTLNLEESYSIQEKKADILTSQIKEIILRNGILRSQLENYHKSYEIKVDVDTKKIGKIYGELDKEIGIQLSRTLEDAVGYRNKLLKSRKNFINKKVLEIEKEIELNDQKKTQLKEEQGGIIRFLEEKKVFADLKSSFKLLNQNEKELAELKGKTSLLDSLKKVLLKLNTSYSQLQEQINLFIEKEQVRVGELRGLYSSIYEKLYPTEGKGFFDIIFEEGKDSKISIVASSRDGDGFGKNRGCALIYDLTILFNIISKNLPYPRFWIHDGVFYGVYKNQLMDTLKLIQEKSVENDNFQYIITMNLDEQGRIKSDIESLGIDLDECEIATYSNIPSEKIFGKDF